MRKPSLPPDDLEPPTPEAGRLMAHYHLTRAEQETTIRWDREDPTVHLWSADPVTWRKLARLGILATRETRCHGAVSGRFYTIPLNRFRWGVRRGPSRPGNPAALEMARQARRSLSLRKESAGAHA
ncbi:MAG: hypothetical protein L0214_15710 [candidate division NC10 bacterium]|nr:hypothetical protein [candidate division NC10 bacterium]